ncbi:hypothetical protein [Streptomyces flaveolus]|uniref:hypothetical protein n=1 Tax=Streptomyces flaveolus TaxID=67297 RepID=UPI0019A409F7|nr:hypothetical protein [Streptomyces flaveolus]GGQ83917.1 hypothetical protein GCM10010216_52290 [Streptomyces flaveolus]
MTSDAATSAHAIPPDVLDSLLTVSDVLESLAVPDFDALTSDQVRGAVCVWGTDQLKTETVVDLGEPVGPAGRWFARTCRQHLAARARSAVIVHGSCCEQCIDDRELCETGRALYRLTKADR